MGGALAEAASDLRRGTGQPVEAAEFSEEVCAALRKVFAFDGWCLIGFDPQTHLRTVQFGGRGTGRTAEMARNEALMADVNRYRDLAVASVPAGCLSVDHPRAHRSYRLHEVLLPQGFHSELRLVLRDRARVWGALVLFRDDPRRVLDDDDVAAACAIAGPLTSAVRAYSVRPLTVRGHGPGGGVVALTPDDRIVSVSAQAQRWLDDLVPGGDDQTWPTDVTRVLFEAAHRLRSGDTAGAASCVRTVSGHWLRVEATELAAGEADVAVVLRPATVDELVGVYTVHQGLTARESQILALLVHGLPGKHIARDLRISLLTVNGHLGSIYRKCGVAGRDQILARLV